MKEPRHGLPPCDHDECPTTRCARLAGDFSPSRVGHFAREACGHYCELHVVETIEEAKKIIPEYGEFAGCCEYDHSSRTDLKAKLVFLRSELDIPLIAHECTHAALEWVSNESMPAAPEGTSEEELQAYFREAVCRVVESLVADALSLMPNKEVSG